ncbi:hypothetical protein [Nitrosomonas sp.]|uniref:hypothetical protein n=1 Tax=Nitrosomonas sp. TaxID=42353 RepID=UPI001D85DA6F|nr:hypothetical protein [Nitrosomonas sp.]MBX3615750.1 hypothetical protein [Nitrosomonas sp.]
MAEFLLARLYVDYGIDDNLTCVWMNATTWGARGSIKAVAKAAFVGSGWPTVVPASGIERNDLLHKAQVTKGDRNLLFQHMFT